MTPWVLSVDLWGTLITYGDRDAEAAWRAEEFHRVLTGAGHGIGPDRLDRTLRAARAQLLAQQRVTGAQISVHTQVEHLLAVLNVPADPTLADVLAVAHTHAVLRACPAVISGAHAALAHARDLGARIYLNSNTLATPAPVTRQILDQHQLTEYLDGGVYSSDVGYAKPRPEMFRAAADAAGVVVTEIVHVGNDWRTDVLGALAAGCKAVWFNPRHKPSRPEARDITGLAQMPYAAAAAIGILPTVPPKDHPA